jgi:hypothetical protein
MEKPRLPKRDNKTERKLKDKGEVSPEQSRDPVESHPMHSIHQPQIDTPQKQDARPDLEWAEHED